VDERPPLPEEYEGLVLIGFMVCGFAGAIMGCLLTLLIQWLWF
jgi:hypothetical protein